VADDNDSSQEKTEEASARKLEKAREDGQIPRSRDLTTTAILLAGTFGLYIFADFMASRLVNITRYNFSIPREAIFDPQTMIAYLSSSFFHGFYSLLPLFGILLVASIVGPIALGGWLFSTKAMAPKLSRMNPLAGLKRMFSVKALVELGKALGKVLVILGCTILLLLALQQPMFRISDESIEAAVIHSLEISGFAAIVLAAITAIIAAVDIPFQIWDHNKKLKMTKQELKDEAKDTDGKPEVKGRIRQLQREISQRRMMAAVPDADVVITNPTHFAVALKYDPEKMGTPILIAKGGDHIALKIREIAKAHKVEMIESPVLARAVFYTTEIDKEIPAGLYVAVAQVLAYVFQLRNFRKGQGDKPLYPRNIKVPKDLQFD
jgi:flagellar biosynthetic protein FlhB